MGLTKKELAELTCAHCEEPFETYAKEGQTGAAAEVPWVRDGIVSISEEDGQELHFHGYFRDPRCCYRQANPDG